MHGAPRASLQSFLWIAPIVALLLWLAFAQNPTESRKRRLNELILSGQLGRVDAELQRRLDVQFRWLARHAGAQSMIVVNEPIGDNQLSLVVTTPAYRAITGCDSGNAIFDPTLNTIFIDRSLVWPTEVNIIGTPSVSTMFGVADLGYVASYTSFILAHELGHWQAHDRSAAFFYYGWNDGVANLDQEKAADRSAVRTLVAAGRANDEPAEIKTANALGQFGMSKATLSADERVAADLLGGILGMSYDLLFSSSAFSPYYSDKSHPNFLDRVNEAMSEVEHGLTGDRASVTELVSAELQRFRALSAWPHRELFFPGPLTVADVRANALWLGRTDIPEVGPDVPPTLDEQVYRIGLAELKIREQAGSELILPSPIKIGRSKVGEEFGYAENVGTWVQREFDDGDPSIGLSSAPVSSEPVREGLGGIVRWIGSDAYEDFGWSWTLPSGGRASVTEHDLKVALGLPLADGVPTLGTLQRQRGAIAVPFVVNAENGWTFRVNLIDRLNALLLTETKVDSWTPSLGEIEIAAARYWHGGWWVPVRVNAGRAGDRVDLFLIRGGTTRLFASAPLLVGEAGSLDSRDLFRLQPANPLILPVSGDRAIFGYENDSFYLIDDAKSSLNVLFHPAKKGLRIVDLGDGRVLFWTLHARKAYLIDTGG